jgi:uncharacterized protein DUF1579
MMKHRLVWLFAVPFVAGTLDAQAPAQVPTPGPEHKRLEVFLGKWTIQGDAKASPYGPAGKITATDTFEWLPGGFFMIHRSDGRQGTVEVKWTEILGYDARNKVYTTRTFDNFGNSGTWKSPLRDNTWAWTGESEVGGKPLKERCTVAVNPPNSLTAKCEYSTDGAKWQPTLELKGARAN